MIFPTLAQMQMAMIGYSLAQQEHAGRAERSGHVERRLDCTRQEYLVLLEYTEKLKRLYTAVIEHAQTEHHIEYPLPPGGMATSLKARVTRLHFFEAGDEMTSQERRVYGSAFPKGETRSIYYELNLLHIPPGRRIDFDIEARWTNSETGPFSSKLSSHILAGWEYSWHAAGVGWAEPGNWPVGDCAVSLFIGDEYVVSGTFRIV